MKPLPTLAIVGRPNVGKSTLFNRLVGRKLALVDDQPGVTRDRRYAEASLSDLQFRLIDTAGLEEASAHSLQARMTQQAIAGLNEADIILFTVDIRAGVTPADRHFAEVARRSNKPVIVIANKAESARANASGAGDLYALGFKEIVLLSAEHGEGMMDLYDVLRTHIAAPSPPDSAAEGAHADKPIQLVILGRPNAGKSTLVNALLGEQRMLVGPEAGITRDTIAVPFTSQGRQFLLHDTAGMRKRANVAAGLEKMAVNDSLRALTFAEIVVLLIDATAPLEKQDAALAALIEREGRACVLGLNKWDLVPAKARKGLREEIDYLLGKQVAQLAGLSVVPLSALDGTGLDALMRACLRAHAVWNQRVPTAALNRWLEGSLAHHSPPLVKGRRLKIKYMTQVKSRPPTFHLFCNMADEFPDAYLRYLTAGIRESFAMAGTPIRLILKDGKNPYAKTDD